MKNPVGFSSIWSMLMSPSWVRTFQGWYTAHLLFEKMRKKCFSGWYICIFILNLSGSVPEFWSLCSLLPNLWSQCEFKEEHSSLHPEACLGRDAHEDKVISHKREAHHVTPEIPMGQQGCSLLAAKILSLLSSQLVTLSPGGIGPPFCWSRGRDPFYH